MSPEFRQNLEAALRLELPYGERRVLEGGRPASVLLLIGASEHSAGEPEILITERTDSVSLHKRQMAFPGGASEPEELAQGEQGLILTALRETDEEIGIPGAKIEPIGRLPAMTTITDFRVTPVVGLLREPIEACPLRPNPHEIASAIWIKLSTLGEPGIYRLEHVRVGAVDYPIHVYQVGGYRIWGATGAMIKNFLDRLQRIGCGA